MQSYISSLGCWDLCKELSGHVWLIVQNNIMSNDGYLVLYFLSNCVRCSVFLLCMKNVDDVCTCIYSLYKYFHDLVFKKKKKTFCVQRIKLSWKEKYLLFISWYEINHEKEYKNWRNCIKDNTIVYIALFQRFKVGYCVYFIELEWFCTGINFSW